MLVTTLTEFPVSALMTTVALCDVLITFAAHINTQNVILAVCLVGSPVSNHTQKNKNQTP